ncbi:tetratricopeptide repeat protein [Aestuariivirga sp.]|uniref:tetratricopeptide repeat protein n=1 Tax=Aestuariivirga sp. TaxID=2650926 RepID=UPI0025C6735D|nr:tetratricopeptide repeat protein [Aestuariivirga sp.]MCA3554396.1 tetratricopeptide repeat protein [Aestuariivirga sp.]
MSNTLIRLRRAVGLLEAGDFAGAIGVARTVLLAEPRNFDALHIVALAGLRRGEPDTALAHIEKALSVRRDMDGAFNTHGMILRALGRLDEAAEALGKAVKLNPKSREAHYNLGNCLQDLGRPAAALERYDAALRLDPSMLMAWNNRGLALRRLGRGAEAVASFGEAIRRAASFAPAYSNRGDALAALGRRDEAIADYDRAIALKPDFAEAHCNRANALMEQGETAAAIAGYDRTLAVAPRFFQAQMGRGIALAALGRPAEAEEWIRRAAALEPGSAEAQYNLGKLLREQGRPGEALAAYDRAIASNPGHAESHGNRGTALKELGRMDEALDSLDRAIALNPDFAEAHSNRGNVLAELMRFEAALAAHDRAVALQPQAAEFHVNRGGALKEMNRLEESLACFDRAIALRPDYAEAYSNRGNVLRELGRLDEAHASFDRAIALSPGADAMRYNKSILALESQDLALGFALYRTRWNTPDLLGQRPRSAIPGWDGSAPGGPLLLWGEQGVGDEVFYASLLSLLDPGLSAITVAADRRLHPIFRRSFPGLSLCDRAEMREEIAGDFAAQAPLGDLGHLLGVDAAARARRRMPYLIASPERRRQLLADNPVLVRRPVCGLSWKSANKKIGPKKSLRLIDLAPLIATPGMSFVNLQYGEVEDEIAEVRAALGVSVHRAEGLDVFNDIDGLLALIDLCDTVLTTSNVTAHLAGALAKQGVVLAPVGSGRLWYWGGERQSLWYPSLTLVHQQRIGGWDAALAEACPLIRGLDAARLVL